MTALSPRQPIPILVFSYCRCYLRWKSERPFLRFSALAVVPRKKGFISILYIKSPQIPAGKKQGRIHGKTVADGWAGAVMPKPLAIQQGRIHGYPNTCGWAGAVFEVT